MKNNIKRVLSVLLAAAMLLGISVTSFAAEYSDTGESQPILRGPAKPITSLTVEGDYWDASFVSAGTHKVWTLKKDFVVTEDMLP